MFVLAVFYLFLISYPCLNEVECNTIPIVWYSLSNMNCSKPMELSISLLQCLPDQSNFSIHKASCLVEQTFLLDRYICEPTTVEMQVGRDQSICSSLIKINHCFV